MKKATPKKGRGNPAPTQAKEKSKYINRSMYFTEAEFSVVEAFFKETTSDQYLEMRRHGISPMLATLSKELLLRYVRGKIKLT